MLRTGDLDVLGSVEAGDLVPLPVSPKEGRNRMHIDVTVTAGAEDPRARLEEEKDRIVALGATVVRLIDQQWGPWPEHYYQLRDPERNEFCLQ